jgi:hypothetical protein
MINEVNVEREVQTKGPKQADRSGFLGDVSTGPRRVLARPRDTTLAPTHVLKISQTLEKPTSPMFIMRHLY